MTPEDFQIAHHNALLKMRCQDRIIESEHFASAWDAADIKQQRACYQILRRLETTELKMWIADVLFSDLSVQRVRILRQLASNHHIPNYSHLSKEELLKVLALKGITHGKS